MKSNIKIISQVCCALLFLISPKAVSQENPSFTITPELSKQVAEKYSLEGFKIYHITSKEVEYYPYVDGQIITAKYKYELKRIEEYKHAYEKYMHNAELVYNKRMAIKKIAENIDVFLDSNEKSDVKERLLVEYQALADKYDIKVTSSVDNRLKLKDFINFPETNRNSTNIPERQILIHQKDKRFNKNDLRIYKDEIQKIKVVDPEMTNNYRMYLEASNNILTILKTETGRILSDEPSKKSVYIIDETPVNLNALSGEFKELSERYSVSLEAVTGKFVKNELFTESNEHHNKFEKVNSFPIIKKSESNEMYYVTSDRFVPQLIIELENINYTNLGNTAEYKTWKAKYVSLQQSAQVNVNSCNAIIKKHTYLNLLGQKRYDSDTFTKQEKVIFNKNLDLLYDKLQQIGDLDDKRDFLAFYNNKASTEEAVNAYKLSTFYTTTSRCY